MQSVEKGLSYYMEQYDKSLCRNIEFAARISELCDSNLELTKLLAEANSNFEKYKIETELKETLPINERIKVLKTDKKIPKGFYVYCVMINSEVKYIGKGRDSRYLHALSGRSSSVGLNHALLTGEELSVYLVKDNIRTEKDALELEAKYIAGCKKNGSLFNKVIPKYVVPCLMREETLELLASAKCE